jgi:hypothetical protein
MKTSDFIGKTCVMPRKTQNKFLIQDNKVNVISKYDYFSETRDSST